MNIWTQTLLVFAVLMMVMGYFQYRKHQDIIDVITELIRPACLVPAVIGSLAYLILKLVFSGLSVILGN